MHISPERCIDGTLFPGDISAKSKTGNTPEVKITAVDNFQGEENRVILLSLVQSNKNRKIGYLQVPNRVCVALSRTRDGLFVIGNMTCLRQASPLWEKVISKADTLGLCGKHLELKCFNHKDTKMIVETPQDFEKYKDEQTVQRLEDCCHIFELSCLDEYMDKRDSERHVGMNVCPRCTTPILHSKRYGNVIRECSQDIDAAKRKINCLDIIKDRNEVLLATVKLKIKDDRAFFLSCIWQAKNKPHITAIRNQLNFYMSVTKSIAYVTSKYKDIILEEKRQDILKELHGLQKWILIQRFRFSEQELSEFKLELTRVRLSLRVEALMRSLQKIENGPQCDSEWTEMTNKSLNSGEKLNEKTGQKIEIKLNQLEKQYPHSGLGISDDERIMVLKAMGFAQKGHVYAIGDCGGAMTEGKCPECQETIVSSSHRLRDDNQVAAEMDGAQFSAWSEQANMQNYDLVAHLDEMF
ncbi:hypothetical protein ACJMK2_012501 [Sinanodonta woodiana]|uniref:RZ-type domain-containing protein n=1 Tax=Sinanodonta woodiana TaxID=1069815 RepID=A0ABD3VBG0_SINWO